LIAEQEDDVEIIEAFERFVKSETNWNIFRSYDGKYIGKTFERYLCFKAGYLLAKK